MRIMNSVDIIKEFYKNGDEMEWVNIHISSGEFTSFEIGLRIFMIFMDYL